MIQSQNIRVGHLLLWMVAALVLCFPAVQPFLRGELPLTADGTLHLYRLVSLDHAMAEGSLWPRYVPGMAYGFGAPLFNYYSPLSLYPMQGLQVFGLSFLNAWLAGMMLYTLAAFAGMALLGRLWAGPVGALIAGTAYVYAPYTLYDSIWRGTVAEFASLAVLPFVLWAMTRLVWRGGRLNFVLVVLSFALFMPMHNVITLHSAVLIGAYAAFLCMEPLFTHGTGQRVAVLFGRVLRLGPALVMGLLLAAFFWLPAITETDYVKITGVTENLPEIDVIRNLGPLGDVFALPITADPTQLQPPVPIALSWPQMVLAVVALLLALSPRGRRWRGLVLLSLALTGLFVFMNTEASAVIWRTVPLIRYSQFPWRLVGLASLLLALCAGIGVALMVDLLRHRGLKLGILAASLAVIMLYAVPWLYTIYLPDVNPQTIADAQDFEREAGFIATSSFGEYIPIWTETLPDPNTLTDRFADTPIIPRLEPPPGVTLSTADWGSTSAALTVTAAIPAQLTFDWLYFPGWQSLVNGSPVEVRPTPVEGRVSVALPEGTHQIEIWLANTARQNTAWALSGAALLALILVVVGWRPAWAVQLPQAIVQSGSGWREALATAVAVGLIFIAVKVLVIDTTNNPLRAERFASGIESGLQRPVNANFSQRITLLGYDPILSAVPSGGTARLDLYWRLNDAPVSEDYSTVLTLRDTEGLPITETIEWQPGGISTRNWLPGTYVQQRAAIPVPPSTPPGEYTLYASLYEPVNGRSLDLINTAGNPEGVEAVLGTIAISRPVTGTVTQAKSPLASFAALDLVEVEPLPDVLTVGDEFIIAWTWAQREVSPDARGEARLIWFDEAGAPAAESSLLPLATGYPVTEWQVGDIWRGQHRLYVPATLDAGTYTVAVRLDGEDDPVSVQMVQVNTPDRDFTEPNPVHRTEAAWANGIILVGYDLDGEQLTLYWQTTEPLNRSLRFFAHLVDESETIVALVDGVPVNWTRPTTSWAAGEVIRDTVLLPGAGDPSLSVRLGWYDTRSGERVSLAETSDDTLLLERDE